VVVDRGVEGRFGEVGGGGGENGGGGGEVRDLCVVIDVTCKG